METAALSKSLETSAADGSEPAEVPFDDDVFESSDFDPIKWIDSNVSSANNAPDKVAELLTSLQTSFLSTHSTFTSSLQSALRAVPTAVRDVEKLRIRATGLRAAVDGVGERVLSVETGVTESVSTISSADALVQRVEGAVDLLKKAWDAERLLERLDALMAATKGDGSELVSAADVLHQVRVCLKGLEGVEELKGRRDRLEGFDRKLEGLAKPRLKTALIERNAALAANVRTVFTRAGRESSFATQYVSIRTDEVQKLWTIALTPKRRDTGEASTHDTGLSRERSAHQQRTSTVDLGSKPHRIAYDDFNKELSKMLVEEFKYLQEAFPEISRDLLSSLVSCAIPSLEPPMPTASTLPVYPATASVTLENLEACALSAFSLCSSVLPFVLPEASSLENADEAAEESLDISQDEAEKKASDNLDGPMTVLGTMLATSSLVYETFPKILIALATEKARRISYGAPRSLSDLSKSVKDASSSLLTIPEVLRDATNKYTCGYLRRSLLDSVRVAENVTSERLASLVSDGARGDRSQESSMSWAGLQASLKLLNTLTEVVLQWREKRLAVSESCTETYNAEKEVKESIKAITESNNRNHQKALLEAFCKFIKEGKTSQAQFLWYRTQSPERDRTTDEANKDLDASEADLDLKSSGFKALITATKKEVHKRMLSGVRQCFAKMRSADWEGDKREDEYAGRSPSQYATDMADWLMTVPQQLEPFVPEDDAIAQLATPVRGELDFYSKEHNAEDVDDENCSTLSFAGGWIDASAAATMGLFWNQINSLSRLSSVRTEQLATDVEYVSNVLSALGVQPTDDFQLIRLLLESPADVEVFEDFLRNDMPVERKLITRRVAALRSIKVRV